MKAQETIPPSPQEGGGFTKLGDSWGQLKSQLSPRVSPTANSKKPMRGDSRGQFSITYALHKGKYVYIAIKSQNRPHYPHHLVVTVHA